MSQVHEGGCLCGAVRYRAHNEPLRRSVCHCRNCQRRTGSAFGIGAYFSESDVELSTGNNGYVQARASVSGRLVKSLAGRVAFSGTRRDGFTTNVVSGDDTNRLNNLGVRGQLLYAPTSKLAVTLAIDHTRQRPEGYTQVVAGVAPTLRPLNRQYAQIAADLRYTAPSFNASIMSCLLLLAAPSVASERRTPASRILTIGGIPLPRYMLETGL